jgi:hypothetical protein
LSDEAKLLPVRFTNQTEVAQKLEGPLLHMTGLPRIPQNKQPPSQVI